MSKGSATRPGLGNERRYSRNTLSSSDKPVPSLFVVHAVNRTCAAHIGNLQTIVGLNHRDGRSGLIAPNAQKTFPSKTGRYFNPDSD
jgi:hypothetical protein